MFILGGTFPTTDQCDSPDDWGLHNLHLNGKSPAYNTLWDRFYLNITTYQVPDAVIGKIGGRYVLQ
jgi:hypothetical protein